MLLSIVRVNFELFVWVLALLNLQCNETLKTCLSYKDDILIVTFENVNVIQSHSHFIKNNWGMYA